MKWLRPLLLAALVAIATPAAAVISFTAMRDANLTIPQDTVSVVTINAFSAARTLTIPNPGQTSIGQSGPTTYYQNALSIYDAAQGITASNTLTIQAASGTINGSATLVVTVTGATVNLIPTSGSNWQATVLSASGATITPTTCTNQFVRAIAASGAATCATVGTSDLAASLSLVTPNINVATATSVNGVGLTGSGTITSTASTSIGRGQYLGTNDATVATAGNVGELISSTIASGSAVSLSNNSPANLTSISVTAGDWDVSCNLIFVDTGTTVVSYLLGSISTTTGTVSTTPGQYTVYPISTAGAANTLITSVGMWIGPLDAALSAPTTYFCVAQGGFTVSTLTVYGILRARRVH